MSNDLISRSALKEHKFPIPIVGDYQQGWNDAIDTIIDNAPTVEPTFGLFKEMLCEECGKRPHGEWIEFKGGYYKCDKCGEVERAKKNFCSKCGVDMRVKDELKREENKL